MTGCNKERVLAGGPSHKSQCGELTTDSHAITMRSSHAAMGASTHAVDSSHVPMLSPDMVIDVILAAANPSPQPPASSHRALQLECPVMTVGSA